MAFSAQAMDHTKPQMLKDKYYKEYWEQHFLFDDGTFVTSQFLAANFPWPVGKDHGIMIATVVKPDGTRTIIKNGRDLGKWGFDPDKFSLYIHTHRVKQEAGQHDLHLMADDKNEVNVTGAATTLPFEHPRYKNGKNVMESAFYLPFFEGQGNWKLTPGKKQPFTNGEGTVQGFGTHVLLNGRLEDLVKNWLRVSGLRGDGTEPIPLLSAIERPDGERDIILNLKNPKGDLTVFTDVKVTYEDFKKGHKNSSYPTVIKISARNCSDTITGSIRLTRKIDHFNIMDHLNFFERGFARSRAATVHYRYIAEYDLDYVTEQGSQKLTGKAFSEFSDILPPKKKKKRKKRR